MNPSKLFLGKIASARFGAVPLGDAANFYHRLNDQVTALCRSLPRGAQAEAMFFFMEYAGIPLGEHLDFFRNYQRPVWSVLYRLALLPEAAAALTASDRDTAIRAHAMAMVLHSLDDHLADGQIPVTHLLLLVRGQAWRLMTDGIDSFCGGDTAALAVAGGLIDEYYACVSTPDIPRSLDHYCALVRGQSATGLVMPLLSARKILCGDGHQRDLRSAFESFTLAWRLLDDIQDMEADLAGGDHSAVYACLGDEGRALWDSLKQSKGRAADKTSEKICAMIRDASILETIAGRIVSELDHAAGLSDRIRLGGLADEFRTLAGPVIDWLA